MGIQCLLPDCGHCSDHDKCKYYRIPKDLFEYYKWKHFLESVVNINEQLCSLLKLSQIMLLSFLCQSCTLFSLVLWSEFCVRYKPYLYTQNKKRNCQITKTVKRVYQSHIINVSSVLAS